MALSTLPHALESIKAIKSLKGFIGSSQLHALNECLRGEERRFFMAKLDEYADRIQTMPKTYEQDGMGDKAIAYLHYFRGNQDWYITEKDSEGDQYQAFGYADLGYGGEMGYISIVELIRHGVELDLYFTPCTMGEIKSRKDA